MAKGSGQRASSPPSTTACGSHQRPPDNVLGHNLVRGNSYVGLVFTNSRELAATGNQITNDTIAGDGVDIADLSAASAPSAPTASTTTVQSPPSR